MIFYALLALFFIGTQIFGAIDPKKMAFYKDFLKQKPINNAYIDEQVPLKDEQGNYTEVGKIFVENLKILAEQNKLDPQCVISKEQIEKLQKLSNHLDQKDRDYVEQLKPRKGHVHTNTQAGFINSFHCPQDENPQIEIKRAQEKTKAIEHVVWGTITISGIGLFVYIFKLMATS